MEETWRPVVGYKGLYEVSAYGQVKNVRGKLLSHSVSSDGYHEVNLTKDKKLRTLKVHRLVVEAFLPDQWNPELEVNHKDGNKDNNHFSNLEMVTHAQNMDHYWRSEVFQEHQKAYSEYAKEAMTARWKNPEFRNKVQSVFDSAEYKKKLTVDLVSEFILTLNSVSEHPNALFRCGLQKDFMISKLMLSSKAGAIQLSEKT